MADKQRCLSAIGISVSPTAPLQGEREVTCMAYLTA